MVLLMDNFSAHDLGVQIIGGVTALTNALIIWLPANTTSKWQPLDQGIINAWKAHTRRHLVRYLLRIVEQGPIDVQVELPKVKILQAIRCAVEAWNNDVQPSTIFNCFTKSSVKLFEPSFLPTTVITTAGSDGDHGLDPKIPRNRITSLPDLDAKDEAEIQLIQEEILALIPILQKSNHIQEVPDINRFLNPIEECINNNTDILEVYYFPI